MLLVDQTCIEMPWAPQEDGDSRWVMFYDPGDTLIEVAVLELINLIDSIKDNPFQESGILQRLQKRSLVVLST